MDNGLAAGLTSFTQALTQYMNAGNEMTVKQQYEAQKSNQDFEMYKKQKLYDAQLDEMRDVSKHDRETVPFSIFQNRGIEEAEMFRPTDRISVHDAMEFFRDRAKAKGDKNSSSINQLRGDFLSQSKTFSGVGEGMQRVIDSAQDPSPAGDLSLIYNYMKMLDPNSVVREGEFATAQNSGSVPQSIAAQYNKVLNGERLTGSMRNDFVTRSVKLFRGQEALQRQRKGAFSNLATRQGIDPATVTFDIPTPPHFDTELEAARATNLRPGSYVIIGDRLAKVK